MFFKDVNTTMIPEKSEKQRKGIQKYYTRLLMNQGAERYSQKVGRDVRIKTKRGCNSKRKWKINRKNKRAVGSVCRISERKLKEEKWVIEKCKRAE